MRENDKRNGINTRFDINKWREERDKFDFFWEENLSYGEIRNSISFTARHLRFRPRPSLQPIRNDRPKTLISQGSKPRF